MKATTTAQDTRTLSTPRRRSQFGTPSAAVSATPMKTQKKSIARSAELTSIVVSPRMNPSAYEISRLIMKTSTAQRTGWGPVIARCELNRTSSHQQNSRKPATRPGRPRSVMPGTIRRAGISMIRPTIKLSSVAAST
jgi:hypothetical protein